MYSSVPVRPFRSLASIEKKTAAAQPSATKLPEVVDRLGGINRAAIDPPDRSTTDPLNAELDGGWCWGRRTCPLRLESDEGFDPYVERA